MAIYSPTPGASMDASCPTHVTLGSGIVKLYCIWFSNGVSIRAGMWYKHQRQGEGKMIWRDRKGGKEIFVGQWEAGIQHGKGKHVWFYKRVTSSQYPIRNSYEGEWSIELVTRDGKVRTLISGLHRRTFMPGPVLFFWKRKCKAKWVKRLGPTDSEHSPYVG